MSSIAALLFDIDGTLIDSNDAHAQAWKEIFDKHGYPVEYAEIRRRIGMGGNHLLPELTGLEKDSSEAKRMDQERGDLFRSKYLPKLKPFTKSRDLLQTLKARAYTIVTATSASQKDMKGLLKQAELEGLFEATTNSKDVEQSKPSPDLIEAALKMAKVDSRRAIMVGDTPYDIQAATKAGVKTIALTCGGWSEEALIKAGAWKVYENPEVLLREVISGRAF